MNNQPPEQPQYPQSSYGTQPPPPTKKKVPWWLWAIGIFLVLGLCGGILQALGITGTTGSPTTSSSTPAKATTAPTPHPTAQAKTLDQQVNDIVQTAGLNGSAKSVYNVGGDNYEKVTEDIGDGNLTNSLTVSEIKLDCFAVQKALWTKMRSHLSEVEFVVTMNVVDQYGAKSNRMVGDCDLKAPTEQKFHWDTLTFDMAWPDYDSTFVAPFLTQ